MIDGGSEQSEASDYILHQSFGERESFLCGFPNFRSFNYQNQTDDEFEDSLSEFSHGVEGNSLKSFENEVIERRFGPRLLMRNGISSQFQKCT